MYHEVIEGTWRDVAKQAARINKDAHVRLEVLGGDGGKMITRGMFPQLKAVTDEDFRDAEWHTPSTGEV